MNTMRFQAARGMSRAALERIYGRDAVDRELARPQPFLPPGWQRHLGRELFWAAKKASQAELFARAGKLRSGRWRS